MKTLAQILAFLQQRQLLESQQLAQLMVELGDLTPEAMCLHDLTNDSRQVTAGAIFIALQGVQSHALDYLTKALHQGVRLILSDRALTPAEQQACQAQKALVIVIASLAAHQAYLAAEFFDHPSRQLKVIGITGTNGKTSTAFYCAQLLQALGQRVAMIGTLGYGLLDDLQKGMNTTPDVLQVQRLLARFVAVQADFVVMEVSSHAIELGRIAHLHFTTLALTQVTSDHLDFHGTQQAYEAAKIKLFRDYVAEHKVVNLNDHIGQGLVNRCHPHCLHGQDCQFWGYALQGHHSHIEPQPKEWLSLCLLSAYDLQLSPQGVRFTLRHAAQTFTLEVPLLGAFNAENLLCALSCVLANHFAQDAVLAAMSQIRSVAGRMQIVHRQPTVVVDFAHTADALEKLLQALSQHQQDSSLMVLFGCGGDRDQQKRPLMAQVAERYADKVFITSDNPRYEDPQQIIEQIVAGLQKPAEAQIEIDRRSAIRSALEQLSVTENAVLVIAGKGHEDYQEIAAQRFPFSDAAVVQEWFAEQAETIGK
ncbi:UDP-N-acetylmuramoyl-L-alanyl-D-glutamate--2,6-diaminopimelate ligase [Thiosulfatimonas sediminis]|uniref:UDP-N-acetylmuramoyl-L-alanyl-D-glutamate--2,6-diaminopimelate ligase n=1 Tax=Thiosulfatimonas sediminis TaxID=2675054 RepID=A0A6F8PWZ1_9GAMM|nr:UDP-N-acetylmuramoyl-L-alanyl-D-glutamate--2,6-diaminopimelate ligase [Thiosulfatimonas sediminis]BBP46557.1 UDP-N-acetylmuramoyl-L-alanyl-D-glutamate--2,6-diaminopimelate ligase [Thiosulfatimonas sediminis]